MERNVGIEFMRVLLFGAVSNIRSDACMRSDPSVAGPFIDPTEHKMRSRVIQRAFEEKRN